MEAVPSTHIKWSSCITLGLTMCQAASHSQKSTPLFWKLSAAGETQLCFSIWCHLSFTPFLLHHNEISAGMWSEAPKPWLPINLKKLTWTFYPLWWELEWNFFLIQSWQGVLLPSTSVSHKTMLHFTTCWGKIVGIGYKYLTCHLNPTQHFAATVESNHK